jgi:EAL domain-containing protein (putative c-di-GMP-specific phosphodiesterase class I)
VPEDAAPSWSLHDLRALLTGDPRAGHLVVRYQPVVRTADGEPLGVEALVRWRRPCGALVPPDAFTRVAEDAGLGAALDERVLRRTVSQLADWDAAGIRVHRAGVNLARTSVLRPDLPDVVADACRSAGLRPERLMLEVVEHDRIALDAPALGRLQLLADAGVTIAVDDFGSGFAGVGLLGVLPVGVLKLDRSLLPGRHRCAAAGAPPAEAVLSGVVALAAAVGAEVTAEGVETGEQRALLARLGVPHVQGWYFAPALDAPAVEDYWRAWARPAALIPSPARPGGAHALTR